MCVVPTRIVFGVRNDNAGKVHDHALLEAEGRPIVTSPGSLLHCLASQGEPCWAKPS
ncbi:MAG TPA: hypothetical protein VFR78_08220 [Pyrinomonadaceae bacterium]|nr:hypothetical protein [Pyrinomonadaceae bacterium]